MTQEYWYNLASLLIEHRLYDNVHYNNVTHNFAEMKARKMNYME